MDYVSKLKTPAGLTRRASMINNLALRPNQSSISAMRRPSSMIEEELVFSDLDKWKITCPEINEILCKAD
jgi:hypothetical protein